MVSVSALVQLFIYATRSISSVIGSVVWLRWAGSLLVLAVVGSLGLKISAVVVVMCTLKNEGRPMIISYLAINEGKYCHFPQVSGLTHFLE